MLVKNPYHLVVMKTMMFLMLLSNLFHLSYAIFNDNNGEVVRGFNSTCCLVEATTAIVMNACGCYYYSFSTTQYRMYCLILLLSLSNRVVGQIASPTLPRRYFNVHYELFRRQSFLRSKGCLQRYCSRQTIQQLTTGPAV